MYCGKKAIQFIAYGIELIIGEHMKKIVLSLVLVAVSLSAQALTPKNLTQAEEKACVEKYEYLTMRAQMKIEHIQSAIQEARAVSDIDELKELRKDLAKAEYEMGVLEDLRDTYSENEFFCPILNEKYK
jgi:hypothetical protein